MLRIILSIIIGFALGRERKKHDKSGGSRTLAIVCMIACAVAILSTKIEMMGVTTFNFSRLLAYTIAGISFIGNGVILKYKTNVEGLTTASSLLACVVIGFFLGLSFYLYAIFMAVFVYIILDCKYWNFKKLKNNRRYK